MVAHLRRKCVELKQNNIKLIVLPVITSAFVRLVNTNNVGLFDEYPINSSHTDIIADGPCVNAKHDEINTTVIVTRLFCLCKK